MLIVNGVRYLVEKELSAKYGLSVHWFRKARYEGKSPQYQKLNGKVYYTEENVDKWFKDNLKTIQ
jgi:predicted DNA-binding transcriptional regulator AlpA